MLIGTALGLVLGAAVAATAVTVAGQPGLNASQAATLAAQSSAKPMFAPPAGAPLSFADIIEKVSPAVVSIETRGKVDLEALRRIPGLGQQIPQGETEGPEVRGAGSGFFISADGYIVTNNHVIADADEITVKLTNDTELKAKVVGRDPATDLAVLKVDGKSFPFVTFELSAKPRVGDWVVAVGNPFGLAGTATAGIVSAYGRDINDSYIDYLQVDAPINRGNSGGPTFDLYGRVIGVNTAIITPSGASAGVGFAIPADMAHSITQQLIKSGKIERGYIGVQIQPVTQEIADSLDIKDTRGAYVAELTKGGPSDKAGVQPGDIIRKVNGQSVKSPTDLTRRVAQIRAGQTLDLEVLRAGKSVSLRITAALRPSEDSLRESQLSGSFGAPDQDDKAKGQSVLGLTLRAITPADRKTHSISEDVRGLIISGLDPKSEAAKRGVKEGDVVLQINSQPVTTAAALQDTVEAARKAGRPSVLLLLHREGRNVPLPLPLK
ncbi:MAG: Do family serine endopeptidase [Asticcacaulis sp.]